MNWLSELQVWGTPEQAYKKPVEQHRRADSGGLIGAFSYGGMPHDLAKRNIALFAEYLLPRLRALGVSSETSRHRSAPLSKLEIGVKSWGGDDPQSFTWARRRLYHPVNDRRG